jgi:hypothetical protein
LREARRLIQRFNEEQRQSGLRRAASEAVATMYGYASFPVARRRRRGSSFTLGGQTYPYYLHPYNRAWMNERSVELAIALDFLRAMAGRRILEVGNVTRHYFDVTHDVVDKYERFPGVINEDVVDYQADPYDGILSISTLEHVGWDEQPREPEKVVAAFTNLRSLLAPGATMVVTFPLGYNQKLDELIVSQHLQFSTQGFLKRVPGPNRWIEIPMADVVRTPYGSKFPNANELFVGTVLG